MKEPKKTYVGLAVFFDRLADDGWPEDAGLWPLDGFTTPPIKYPDERVQAAVRRLGGRLEVTDDPRKAATGADVIYTDVWISMGQEAEREQRLEAFGRYQVNEAVVAVAKPTALVMHCLPAHRGEEITDAVLDGPRSIALEQAENRLHAQKAVILSLLGGSVDDA